MWLCSSARSPGSNHHFDPEQVEILAKETKDFPRRVLEVIYIKQQEPSLNRDQGLDLDPEWDPIIKNWLSPHVTFGHVMFCFAGDYAINADVSITTLVAEDDGRCPSKDLLQNWRYVWCWSFINLIVFTTITYEPIF